MPNTSSGNIVFLIIYLCIFSPLERTIVSKALREPPVVPKPAPYPYLEKKFRYFTQLTDRTTPRLDENSKLIAVEGAHCIGKTDFAKELAEEFEMVRKTLRTYLST